MTVISHLWYHSVISYIRLWHHTQDCDITWPKVPDVLSSPFWSLISLDHHDWAVKHEGFESGPGLSESPAKLEIWMLRYLLVQNDIFTFEIDSENLNAIVGCTLPVERWNVPKSAFPANLNFRRLKFQLEHHASDLESGPPDISLDISTFKFTQHHLESVEVVYSCNTPYILWWQPSVSRGVLNLSIFF